MKNLFSALLLSAFLVVGTSPMALAGDQDFVLNNETGFEIHELYVSPTSTNEWEEDVLGADTLADGESTTITFDDAEEEGNWDIMIRDAEGNEHFWHNIDLINTAEITIQGDDDFNVDAEDEG